MPNHRLKYLTGTLKCNSLKSMMWALLLIQICDQAFALSIISPGGLTQKYIEFSYKGIPSNSYSIESNKLKIGVNKSSSPIIFTFDTLQKIRNLQVSGEIISLPEYKNVDDFILRVGPVFSGVKKLSGLQKWFAPDWIEIFQKVVDV